MGRVPCVATGTVPTAVTPGLSGMGAVLFNCRINQRRLPLGPVPHLLFYSRVRMRGLSTSKKKSKLSLGRAQTRSKKSTLPGRARAGTGGLCDITFQEDLNTKRKK